VRLKDLSGTPQNTFLKNIIFISKNIIRSQKISNNFRKYQFHIKTFQKNVNSFHKISEHFKIFQILKSLRSLKSQSRFSDIGQIPNFSKIDTGKAKN
jgi:hypothetical protein